MQGLRRLNITHLQTQRDMEVSMTMTASLEFVVTESPGRLYFLDFSHTDIVNYFTNRCSIIVVSIILNYSLMLIPTV